MSKWVKLSLLSQRDIDSAHYIFFNSESEETRDSLTMALIGLVRNGRRLRRYNADELIKRNAIEIEPTSGIGLFNDPELIVIYNITSNSASNISDWINIFVDDNPNVSLLLSCAVKKMDKKLADALDYGRNGLALSLDYRGLPLLLTESILKDFGLVQYSSALSPLIRSLSQEYSLSFLQSTLALFALSMKEMTDENCSTNAFKTFLKNQSVVEDDAITTTILAGLPEQAITKLHANFTTSSEKSAFLARLPWALARSRRPTNKLQAAFRDIHHCERMIRTQNPLAEQMIERLIVRLARRLK